MDKLIPRQRITIGSAMEKNTRIVFFLLRARFLTAIPKRPDTFLLFLLSVLTSLYLNASTGEIFAAILPGLLHETKTVISAKIHDATKIHGDTEKLSATGASIVDKKIVGEVNLPTIYPRISPMGIPIALNISD